MRHRHLTRERYELALEEDGSAAARYRRQAETCPECSAALAQAPLASLLAAWVAPVSIDRPVDWGAALCRAIAPSSQQRRLGWFRAGRLVAAALVLAGLLLLTALPAAASTGPNSVLFPVRGLAGLLDEPRCGAPRRIGDEQVEAVVNATLETMPDDATHWSTRSMAARSGLSYASVRRIWHAFGLQPHRVETFKLSTDPQFIEKVAFANELLSQTLVVARDSGRRQRLRELCIQLLRQVCSTAFY